MIKKPLKGRTYWYVTDFWEKFYEIPVARHKNGLKWHLGSGLYEHYRSYEPQNLFRKRKTARKRAAKLNKEVRNAWVI